MTDGAHTPLTRAHPDQPANLTDQTAGPDPASAKACQPPFTHRHAKALEQAGAHHGELIRLGFLTANLVGRSFINLGEVALNRMPVVSGIYKAVKQIFETVFKEESHSFRQVGLIEWPGEGLWSLCFITEPAQGALAAALPEQEHLCVFVPCTPNPTTGYLVMMERSRVKEVDITTEEAFKLLMSMGIIQPTDRPGLRLGGAQPATTRSRDGLPNE
jgi:uncharacterized membrane protein